jgi:membrane associated rhomboid family serine protease
MVFMSGLGRTERDHGAVYDYMSAPTALPAQTLDDPHAWVEVARTPDARTTRHMALVLQSMNVPHGIAQMEDGQALLVRRAQAAYAAEQLARYERENRGWPPREPGFAPLPSGGPAAVLYGGLLVLMHILVIEERYGIDWRRMGRNASELVAQGEWWRVVTALTLHGDLAHLAGNLVFGAAFAVVLSQTLGAGVAWCGILLAGSVGNWVNDVVRTEPHVSIGASTAVFGALGMQIAAEWARRKELRLSKVRRWTPVVMGVGLLAWSGMGGISVETSALERHVTLDKVDVGAHLAGFAVGAVLGLAAARAHLAQRLSSRTQSLLATGALLIVVLAWVRALLTLG